MEVIDDLFYLAKIGKIPSFFDKWYLADKDGWTVAHEAAAYGNLPEGFQDWELADNDGITVAYVAAGNGPLPKDFKDWDLKGIGSRTVAHEALKHHLLGVLIMIFCFLIGAG